MADENNLEQKENNPIIKKDVILVTGGAGYIGSILIPNLLNQGFKIRLFDKFLFGLKPIAGFINHPNLEICIGDLKNAEDLESIKMEDVDTLIHLGGIVGDPACAVNAAATIETNLVATTRLVQMAKVHKINRFIFASTCSVYGAKGNEKLNENAELNPVSLYAESKLDAEKQILAFLDEKPTPVILRFGTIYGLSPRPRFDLAINWFVKTSLKNKHIKIFGGDQWRPFIHVADIARSIEVVLKAPIEKVSRETFNVGDPNGNFQMHEIGELVKECIPDTEVEIIKEIRDNRSYNVSFDKIRDVLGFETSKTVKDGILEIKRAIESGVIKNPDDSIYFNYFVPED